MRIDLPSGAWVEVRDNLNADDYYAVQGAVDVEVSSDGSGASVARLPGNHQLRRQDALLAEIITGWSYTEQGIPVPSQNAAGAAAIRSVIGGGGKLDDYRELADAVEPLVEKVNPSRRPNSRKP